jgi:hypothetical protein
MPPEGVDVADDEWIAASNEVRAGSAHCGLCVERIKDDLRAGIGRGGDEDERPARGGGRGERGEGSKAAREGSSCCAGREGDRGTQPDSQGGSRGGGAALSALACKGLTTMLVVGLPPTMPPSGWAAWSPEPVRGEVVRISNERHASRALETPEPPPRGA